MTATQRLFRRHRNRDADENGSTAPSPGGDGGGDNESPPENNRSNGGDGTSEGQNRSTVDSNNYDTTFTLPDTNINHDPNNASPPMDDEEQELVVQIPNGRSNNNSNSAPLSFVLPTIAWEPSEEATAIRREAIHQELQRVQRANFIHFLVLCLVPTTLLLIVIAAILSEDGECRNDSGLTVCQREPRSFVNAFTSRCICDAVKTVVLPDTFGDGD